MKSLISSDGSATLLLDGSTLSDGSQSKIVDGSALLGAWATKVTSKKKLEVLELR